MVMATDRQQTQPDYIMRLVNLTLIAVLYTLCSSAFFVGAASSDEVSQEGGSCLISVPTQRLHNGVEMPILSLGTAQLITVPGVNPELPSDFVGFLPEKNYRQMELALSAGVRAFDTAFIYRSQPPMGRVLAEWWRTGRLESRQDVWITSKIFHPPSPSNTFDISHMADLPNMTPEQVSKETKRHFEVSLHELGVGYIDLMLLHWPSLPSMPDADMNRQRRLAAWKVLEQMYDRGWARAIGVSNFSPEHLEHLKEDGAKIVPMVNQIEASVSLQYPNIVKYCLDNNILPQAYSPLGRGLSEMPELVHQIGEKYGKDAGQVSFRYLLQLGYAVTYLTNSEKRMVSNAQVFDFELSDDEMSQLTALNRPDGGWGLPSPIDLK
jgi:diketogulonate reductase-like aldo/keto reductase